MTYENVIAKKIARRNRRANSRTRANRRERNSQFAQHMIRAYVESQTNKTIERETMRAIEFDLIAMLTK